MTAQEAIDYLYSLRHRGKKDGLRKISLLLAALGNPQEQVPFIHVAGTNGKGSTTAMTACILRHAGYKTGMFISPFILNFRERVQINGQMMPEAALVACVQEMQPHIEKMIAQGDCPSEFEAVTALGFLYFAKEKCDIAVLEVGLGGRLDATNVISRSLVSVITAISLDHMEILGDTVEAIAIEKCGILRPHSDTVSYPDQQPDALGVIFQCCQEQENTLHLPTVGSITTEEMTPLGSHFTYGGQAYFVPLMGRHQIYNAITAIAAIEVVTKKGFPVTAGQIVEGIAAVRFPARLEILSQSPLILLDGAHNDAGAKVLGEALDLLKGRPITAIMGMLTDKDTHGALSHIVPHCTELFTVTPQNNPRAMAAQTLAENARLHSGINSKCTQITPCQTLQQAFDSAYSALPPNGVLLVCGSLYLAADMRQIILAQIGEPLAE